MTVTRSQKAVFVFLATGALCSAVGWVLYVAFKREQVGGGWLALLFTGGFLTAITFGMLQFSLRLEVTE